jgi:hypothetical protein
MADFKFECPHCKQHLKCNTTDSGRQVQCPSCHVLIRIPPVPGQTANYKPEQGKTWDTFVPRKNGPKE